MLHGLLIDLRAIAILHAHAQPRDVHEDKTLPPGIRRRATLVQNLARSYSAPGSGGGGGVAADNPFSADQGSPVNPHSGNFEARAWAKAVFRLADDSDAAFRSLGLCFRNLSVSGSTAAVKYQSNLANIWLSLGDTIGNILAERQQVRPNILRPMDGVIKPGRCFSCCEGLVPVAVRCSRRLLER